MTEIMARDLSDGVERRRKRAIKFAEELGEILADDFLDYANSYASGTTLPQLIEANLNRLESLEVPSGSKYNREKDPDYRVAGAALRYGLTILLGEEEMRRLGQRHILDTAYSRSMQGLFARGQVPYINGKYVEIEGIKYNEIEYIHLLKQKGCSWEEILKMVNSDFYPRSLKGIQAAYSRWKKKSCNN